MIFYQLSINSIQYYLKIIKRTLEFIKLNKMAVKFFWKKNMRKTRQNKKHLTKKKKQNKNKTPKQCKMVFIMRSREQRGVNFDEKDIRILKHAVKF